MVDHGKTWFLTVFCQMAPRFDHGQISPGLYPGFLQLRTEQSYNTIGVLRKLMKETQ